MNEIEVFLVCDSSGWWTVKSTRFGYVEQIASAPTMDDAIRYASSVLGPLCIRLGPSPQ